MLDGTRLDELERQLGLPVLALDFDGFQEYFRGIPLPRFFTNLKTHPKKWIAAALTGKKISSNATFSSRRQRGIMIAFFTPPKAD